MRRLCNTIYRFLYMLSILFPRIDNACNTLQSQPLQCVLTVYKCIILCVCTIVSYEITFSKLKYYILNRLRNCYSQPKFKTFILMSVKRQNCNNKEAQIKF